MDHTEQQLLQLQQVQLNWGSHNRPQQLETHKNSLSFITPADLQLSNVPAPALSYYQNQSHTHINKPTNSSSSLPSLNTNYLPLPLPSASKFGKPPVVWNPNTDSRSHSFKKVAGSHKRKFKDNDYQNNYIHSGEIPVNYVRNVKAPLEGYPKLQRLFQLKEKQVDANACAPYGARVSIENMVQTLNQWIVKDKLVFNVIMIGALTENQLILPLLTQLPLEKLCSKPGFLFIWSSAQKINELSTLLNTDTWAKKFRRSEELVFVPVDKNSPYYPNKDGTDDDALFEKMQWHCWMCITGTVRRATDGHLIHCNVDTDLKIENQDENPNRNQIVPDHIYKVAENFSSATRRLHIIPARSGFNNPVKPRRGWVVMSPDVIIDNFEPQRYKSEIGLIGTNIPQDQEIENIRPKSPTPRNANLSNHNNHKNRSNAIPTY